MPVTASELRAAVEQLGIAGMPVCIHSSLRSFGGIEGGGRAVLDAFVDTGCTVLVPTFSWGFAVPPPESIRPRQNGWDYSHFSVDAEGVGRIYTPESNEVDEDMGVLPRLVLSSTGRIRGEHPLCSFTAIGPAAQALIRSQTYDDIMAPLRILAEQSGVVLTMGVGLTSLTLLHLAEAIAGRSLFLRWANDRSGRPVGVRTGGCSEGFDRLRAILEPSRPD